MPPSDIMHDWNAAGNPVLTMSLTYSFSGFLFICTRPISALTLIIFAKQIAADTHCATIVAYAAPATPRLHFTIKNISSAILTNDEAITARSGVLESPTLFNIAPQPLYMTLPKTKVYII